MAPILAARADFHLERRGLWPWKDSMDPFPHRYRVRGSGRVTGDVDLTAERLTALRSASPAEFDGPGDLWSPETLLVAALADCYILSFRTVARASKLRWLSLDCEVTGTLDRVDRAILFTNFDLTAHLVVPDGVEHDRAQQALEKAERICLISSSLKGPVALNATIEIVEPAEVGAPAS